MCVQASPASQEKRSELQHNIIEALADITVGVKVSNPC